MPLVGNWGSLPLRSAGTWLPLERTSSRAAAVTVLLVAGHVGSKLVVVAVVLVAVGYRPSLGSAGELVWASNKQRC